MVRLDQYFIDYRNYELKINAQIMVIISAIEAVTARASAPAQ